MDYQTIQVKIEGPVFYLRLHRPDANNTINEQLISECHHALTAYGEQCSIVVLEGLPDVFCFGADFKSIESNAAVNAASEGDRIAEPLYALWTRLATEHYITVAHVRGKTNAGGIGFVAACDMVLADETASFSLSELLFGLFPACVLPFLIRRIGHNRANYMTLLNKPIGVHQACSWGLVDAVEPDSDALLRKHLLRVRRINKTGIARYKAYMNSLSGLIAQSKQLAIEANKSMFSDNDIRENISRYVNTGRFPWET